MITTDYHTHSSFSSDSPTPMEDMVKEAIRLGLTRICFTDHMDYDFPKQYNMPFVFDIEEYTKEVKRLQDIYHHDIKILLGIECGMQAHFGPQYDRLVSETPFDFVICSSHLVDAMDPYNKEY